MLEKVGVYCRLSDEDRDKLNKNDDSDSISLTNIFPESTEKARSRTDNVLTFSVSGINTTTDQDIYYEILLNNGYALNMPEVLASAIKAQGKVNIKTAELVDKLNHYAGVLKEKE